MQKDSVQVDTSKTRDEEIMEAIEDFKKNNPDSTW